MERKRDDEYMRGAAESLYEALSDCDGYMPAWKICARISMPERELRIVVAYARSHGHADIVSGNLGYAVARTPEELRRGAARIRAHLFSEMEVYRAMERQADRMAKQTLFEVAGA